MNKLEAFKKAIQNIRAAYPAARRVDKWSRFGPRKAVMYVRTPGVTRGLFVLLTNISGTGVTCRFHGNRKEHERAICNIAN